MLMYTGFERGGMEIKGHWVALESWCIIIRVSRITFLSSAKQTASMPFREARGVLDKKGRLCLQMKTRVLEILVEIDAL